MSTFLVCDMADEHESSTLRYVPLPVMLVPPKEEEDEDDYLEQPSWLYHRTIGAAGAGAVRFVSIDNRCCCGAHVVRSLCTCSSSAFMVTAWTLAVTTTGGGEPMAWVKECVLDCEELWELASSVGLPRGLQVSCPVVSLENPDIICLVAHGGHGKLWTLEVDMRDCLAISRQICPSSIYQFFNKSGIDTSSL